MLLLFLPTEARMRNLALHMQWHCQCHSTLLFLSSVLEKKNHNNTEFREPAELERKSFDNTLYFLLMTLHGYT